LKNLDSWCGKLAVARWALDPERLERLPCRDARDAECVVECDDKLHPWDADVNVLDDSYVCNTVETVVTGVAGIPVGAVLQVRVQY
jgi:hypothetical protein